MSATRSFALLSGGDTVALGTPHGLLFQCAPDAPARSEAANAVALPELIGEFEAVKAQAARLARALLQEEPRARGVQQLGIFEELVIRELQQIIHAKNLHDTLLARGFRRCSIAADAPVVEQLVRVARACGNELAVEIRANAAAPSRRLGSLRRSLGRIAASGFDRAALASEWNHVLSRIDPYHRRPRRKGAPTERGRAWFYSTAQTYTAMGLLYEPWFPQEFQYLVEDPHTGGVPLAGRGRPFASPYAYAAPGLAPAHGEAGAVARSIRGHLASVQVSEAERLLVGVYLESPGFATFTGRLLPQGLFQTSLFARFVAEAAPSCVIVGNPVFEGYLLHAARQAGIPTIVLQHGILGDFCQFIDPPADHYVVRGEFWRDFLAPAAARRAHVLNPPQPSRLPPGIGKRTRVVFLTAPYSQTRFCDLSDLQDILRALLRTCGEHGAPLTIRVHPMEQVGFYSNLVGALPEAGGVTIEYSQGPGLPELLSQAATAVTYCSTAFLDCLRLQVPVISFDWHDFSFKRLIDGQGVFHFGRTLADLRRLVARALSGDLPPFSGATRPFLDPTPEGVLRSCIAALAGVA